MKSLEVEELERLAEGSYSVDSMAGHGAEGRELTYMGILDKSSRHAHLIYKDETNSYWYKTMYKTDEGLISEYEYLFGKPEKKKLYRR